VNYTLGPGRYVYICRYGAGIDNELALEGGGDYTREIGYLEFAKYTNGSDNLLNRIWYQPEEIFPVTGTPEVRVDEYFLDIASKLEVRDLLYFVSI
ncbi:unnamed protein product, partial [Brassica rapa subsp. trilocularis]